MAEPKCRYFGRCGGCSFQNVDYPQQLEQKKKNLANAINFQDIKTFSGKEYSYRNRMDFIFHPSGLGFRERKSFAFLVDVERCEIMEEKLNVLLKEIRDFFRQPDSFDLRKQTGTFKYAVIRISSGTKSISFVLNENSSRLTEAIEKIKMFAEKTTADNIVVTYVPQKTDESVSSDFFAVKGTDVLKERYLGKEFNYSVQGFFQNNKEMAEKMQEYVNELLKTYETKDSHLLDLYSGVGTFGIINSDLFETVVMVESFKGCVDSAEENIKMNDVLNAKAVCLDAKNLRKLQLPKELFVITDPPRSGMDPKTIDQLKILKPKVIIYVSCNVSQLSKDIPKFRQYKIKSVALFDLFPHTPHSEAVVELVLDESNAEKT